MKAEEVCPHCSAPLNGRTYKCDTCGKLLLTGGPGVRIRNDSPVPSPQSPHVSGSRRRVAIGFAIVSSLTLGIAPFMSMRGIVTANRLRRDSIAYLRSLSNNSEAVEAANTLDENAVLIRFTNEYGASLFQEEPWGSYLASEKAILINPNRFGCIYISDSRIRCPREAAIIIPHLASTLVHEAVHARVHSDLQCFFFNIEECEWDF